jgi:ABC-2 type transport system permease protein
MTAPGTTLSNESENLWTYITKLLHLRQVTLISAFKRAKTMVKVVDIALVIVTVGVAVGCYLLSKALLSELDAPIVLEIGIKLTSLLDAITVLMVAGVFILSLMASFRVLLQALYLAQDMDFLMSAPVPIRAIFITKLLETILPNLILVLVFGVPVLISLGETQGFSIGYYFLLLVIPVFLSFGAAGISSLLVMAVVRIFPAKRVAEVLTFLGACMVFLISQSANLVGNGLENLSPDQIAASANLFTKLNNPWMPLVWAGRSLVDIGKGDWMSGSIFLILTIGLSAIIFWLALSTAEKLYYCGWASLHTGVSLKNNRRKGDHRIMNNRIANHFGGWLHSQIGVLLLKDFKQIRRDLHLLSQVVGALIMGIVLGVMLLRSAGEPPSGDATVEVMSIIRSATAYGSMVIGLFVGWGMLSRLALMAFSMEGRRYWMLKSAPVSARKLLVGKFLMAFIPSLALAWFYLISIALLQKPPLSAILYGLPSVGLVLAGLCGINLALGVHGVNLNWTDPRKMENNIVGILATVISIIYQILALALFFGPALLFPALGISEKLGMVVGLAAGGILALICAIVPVVRVKNRIAQIGEE